jgi:hypothetical protein
MARAMLIPLGEDPAFVSRGNLPGAGIGDGAGNPYWHDEEVYPGLDGLRLTALRTVNGENGVYINNANVISPPGSDYVYLQHLRIINRACELAYQQLTKELSKGVGKKAPDPVTGLIYILEADAQAIEAEVNGVVETALAGQVQAVAFQLSRTDDLSSNQGATVHSALQAVALAYIKQFLVAAGFTKFITINPPS